MLVDYHVHTSFSDDSVYPMESVVVDAIAKGLSEICFTDHVDYGVKDDWDSGKEILYRDGDPIANVDYPQYMEEIARMQRQYGDRLAIKTGLEFGMQVHTIPQFARLFQRYRFDCILLSVHQVEDKEFWTQDFQRGRTQQQYNERYYEEMLALVRQYKDYSVLAHMDLITRYDEAGLYPFEKIRPYVEEILKTVIADGKGLEFNTSYHRYGLNDTTPSMDILRLYRSLGGEILTFGSDSHKPEHLGAYMAEAQEVVKSLGFSSFCTYQDMQPVFHKL
ncbi:MAG TPA: histidinol-phosphatase HisJ family protein [Candidatus Butyricicoccus stercorigallinarum]|nr:histidinol-phosphatase HisJ family protein [Candidatus Butyricicoccus stercorigallinarum]